jgi:hypothetical protein
LVFDIDTPQSIVHAVQGDIIGTIVKN